MHNLQRMYRCVHPRKVLIVQRTKYCFTESQHPKTLHSTEIEKKMYSMIIIASARSVTCRNSSSRASNTELFAISVSRMLVCLRWPKSGRTALKRDDCGSMRMCGSDTLILRISAWMTLLLLTCATWRRFNSFYNLLFDSFIPQTFLQCTIYCKGRRRRCTGRNTQQQRCRVLDILIKTKQIFLENFHPVNNDLYSTNK